MNKFLLSTTLLLVLLPNLAFAQAQQSTSYKVNAGALNPVNSTLNSPNYNFSGGVVPIPGSLSSPNYNAVSDSIPSVPQVVVTPPTPPVTGGQSGQSSGSKSPGPTQESSIKFSNINIYATRNTATISFNTSVPTQSYLTYFETTSEIKTTPISPLFLTSHTFVLADLKPDARYYFNLNSRTNSEYITSTYYSFRTNAATSFDDVLTQTPSLGIDVAEVVPVLETTDQAKNIFKLQDLSLDFTTYFKTIYEGQDMTFAFSSADAEFYQSSQVQISLPVELLNFKPTNIILEFNGVSTPMTFNASLNKFEISLEMPDNPRKYDLEFSLYSPEVTYQFSKKVDVVEKSKLFKLKFYDFSIQNPLQFLFRYEVPVENAELRIFEKKEDGTFGLWQAKVYGQSNPVFTDKNGNFTAVLPTSHFRIHLYVDQQSVYQTNSFKNTKNLLSKNINISSRFNNRIAIILLFSIFILGAFALKFRTQK